MLRLFVTLGWRPTHSQHAWGEELSAWSWSKSEVYSKARHRVAVTKSSGFVTWPYPKIMLSFSFLIFFQQCLEQLLPGWWALGLVHFGDSFISLQLVIRRKKLGSVRQPETKRAEKLCNVCLQINRVNSFSVTCTCTRIQGEMQLFG